MREGITLSVNQNARVDAWMQLGQVYEQIQVAADASLVDTRQVQLGGLVDSRRVNDLPLNGRNVYDLVSLLPGITGALANRAGQPGELHQYQWKPFAAQHISVGWRVQ